jgi:hypothetical protein
LPKPSSPRKTKAQIEHELHDIQQMMSTGYTDREIMDKLNLQYRNYQKYKMKIFNASTKAQAQLNENMLVTEKDLLNDRLVRLFRLLEIKAGDDRTKADL